MGLAITRNSQLSPGSDTSTTAFTSSTILLTHAKRRLQIYKLGLRPCSPSTSTPQKCLFLQHHSNHLLLIPTLISGHYNSVQPSRSCLYRLKSACRSTPTFVSVSASADLAAEPSPKSSAPSCTVLSGSSVGRSTKR